MALGVAARTPVPPVGRGPTRREFLAAALVVGCTLAFSPRLAYASRTINRETKPVTAPSQAITLRINGQSLSLDVEPRVTLLDALREYAGLTGTKKGCDHGQCGACTVHVNGRRQLSCLTFAVMHQHDEITTIEGLADGTTLHPMQAAFVAHDGFQCGYCTPGQIMSATALVHEPCGPADADVKECMSGNLCRCGAYPGIVAAIQSVRATGSG
jgi:xanthine dehydrogenase YagT iron-sulfur-binding subunit